MEILVKKGYHEHKVLLSMDEETNETFCTLQFNSTDVNLSYLKEDLHKLFTITNISDIILEFSDMHMENIKEICEIIKSYKKKHQHIKIVKVKFDEIDIFEMNKIPAGYDII